MKEDAQYNIYSWKPLFLMGVFIALLVGMNTLGVKIVSFFGVSVTVGIFMVPIVFLITDIVAEVYGQHMARIFVWTGLAVLVLIFVYALIFVALPPHDRYTSNEAYSAIFGSSLRILLASIFAFLFAQLHDIWAFEFWKKKTQGRKLWLRNNLSTIVSQFIDTTIFMFIAFYGLTPQFDASFVWGLIMPYYVFKVIFAFIDTPFVYWGSAWLRKTES